MAAPGTNRANSEKLLKQVYAKSMRRLYPIHSLLLQTLQPRTKAVKQGEKFTVKLNNGAGSGIMWSSAGNLGPASFEIYDEATFKYAWATARVEFSEDFLQDAGSPESAAAQPLPAELKSVVANSRHDISFDLYRDGSGLLSDLDASPGATATTFKVANTIGLRKNQWLDLVLKSSGAVGAGGLKSFRIAVNHTTKVVTILDGKTLGDATGADVNANPTLYGVYRMGSRNDAVFGLGAMVSDANPPTGVALYGGIDRSVDTNAFWNAVVHANGGTLRVPSMKLMQDVIDQIGSFSSGHTTIIICGLQVLSYLKEKLLLTKRYAGETMMLRGWAKGVQFADMNAPIVADPLCPADKMYFLDEEAINLHQNDDGHWTDKDGAILARLADRIAYQASWSRRLQLTTDNPAAHGVLADLKYDTPS